MFAGGRHQHRFFGRAIVLAQKLDSRGPIGRIRLRIARWRRLNVGRRQRIARTQRRVRMLPGPGDQVVSQLLNAARAAPGIGQFPAVDSRIGDEIPQVLGVSGGERFEDRLIRVADAQPIALLAGQQAQDVFLQA